jgi:hypothetical protein
LLIFLQAQLFVLAGVDSDLEKKLFIFVIELKAVQPRTVIEHFYNLDALAFEVNWEQVLSHFSSRVLM